MKRTLLIVVCLAGLLLLGFYVKGSKSAQASVGNLSDSKSPSELELYGGEQRQARLKRGDTLVLEKEQLASLLPTNLISYEAKGKPNSSQVNMMGDRYTVVEQVYTKDNHQLKVSIADYNAAYTLYNVATAVVAASVTLDTDDQQWQEIDLGIKDVKSWEMYDKHTHKSIITIGIAERFIITLEASKQYSPLEIRDVVKDFKLDTLS